MSINDFLQKDNLATLWDVISDEDIFRFLKKPVQSEISQVFTNNIRGFFESERAKSSNLIDMNKKYIIILLFIILHNKFHIFHKELFMFFSITVRHNKNYFNTLHLLTFVKL